MADVDVTSTSTATVDVVGLNDIKADVKLELPQPFKTEGANTIDLKADVKADVGSNSKSQLTIDPLKLTIDPLKTDSSLALDMKPAVVDLCLTLNVGKVPNLCIRQPYRHKVGFTLYGVEVFGFSFSGEQETIINELSPRPQSLPREAAPWPPMRVVEAPERREPRAASGAGLRIRLEP